MSYSIYYDLFTGVFTVCTFILSFFSSQSIHTSPSTLWLTFHKWNEGKNTATFNGHTFNSTSGGKVVHLFWIEFKLIFFACLFCFHPGGDKLYLYKAFHSFLIARVEKINFETFAFINQLRCFDICIADSAIYIWKFEIVQCTGFIWIYMHFLIIFSFCLMSSIFGGIFLNFCIKKFVFGLHDLVWSRNQMHF